ncbi:MAG: hypothetical protein ACI9U5_001863 [Colwellia sp.]|jgi:hypothetical protein
MALALYRKNFITGITRVLKKLIFLAYSFCAAYYTQAHLEDTNQFHNFHAILG